MGKGVVGSTVVLGWEWSSLSGWGSISLTSLEQIGYY